MRKAPTRSGPSYPSFDMSRRRLRDVPHRRLSRRQTTGLREQQFGGRCRLAMSDGAAGDEIARGGGFASCKGTATRKTVRSRQHPRSQVFAQLVPGFEQSPWALRAHRRRVRAGSVVSHGPAHQSVHPSAESIALAGTGGGGPRRSGRRMPGSDARFRVHSAIVGATALAHLGPDRRPPNPPRRSVAPRQGDPPGFPGVHRHLTRLTSFASPPRSQRRRGSGRSGGSLTEEPWLSRASAPPRLPWPATSGVVLVSDVRCTPLPGQAAVSQHASHACRPLVILAGHGGR